MRGDCFPVFVFTGAVFILIGAVWPWVPVFSINDAVRKKNYVSTTAWWVNSTF
jgi:hypothetical protein